jgi:hypothetical protein
MLNLGTKMSQKGKMSLAVLEEFELEDTMVSIDGDEIYDLAR